MTPLTLGTMYCRRASRRHTGPTSASWMEIRLFGERSSSARTKSVAAGDVRSKVLRGKVSCNQAA